MEFKLKKNSLEIESKTESGVSKNSTIQKTYFKNSVSNSTLSEKQVAFVAEWSIPEQNTMKQTFNSFNGNFIVDWNN